MSVPSNKQYMILQLSPELGAKASLYQRRIFPSQHERRMRRSRLRVRRAVCLPHTFLLATLDLTRRSLLHTRHANAVPPIQNLQSASAPINVVAPACIPLAEKDGSPAKVCPVDGQPARAAMPTTSLPRTHQIRHIPPPMHRLQTARRTGQPIGDLGRVLSDSYASSSMDPGREGVAVKPERSVKPEKGVKAEKTKSSGSSRGE